MNSKITPFGDIPNIAQSPDFRSELKKKLQEILPEAFRDGQIDLAAIKNILSEGITSEGEEKYGLNWLGKRKTQKHALTPSLATLRPAIDESIKWSTTKNIFIEGDNLEVLKLLQKSYAGGIKCIYIDPPYNTGNDFVYPDDFQSSIENYLRITNQTESGYKNSSNTEVSGRYHTDWLNMIYPRIKLAKNLLRKDGLIFVSIDDHEKANLLAVMNEIFGEENFVGVFVWKRRTGAMDSVNNLSVDHEYVICYSASEVSLAGIYRTFEKYENPDNDERGPWIADNLSAAKPGGDTYYPIKDPSTGFEYLPPKGRFWPYSRLTMQKKIEEGRIIFPGRKEGSPLVKRFKNEAKSLVQPISTWINPNSDSKRTDADKIQLSSGFTSEGTKVIKELFDEKVFTYAKPLSLIQTLIEQSTSNNSEDIVLDFFAGSGTTGHATINCNVNDSGNRRYILVQLPEPLSDEVEEQKAGAQYCDKLKKKRAISELTKERLRRVAGLPLDHDLATSSVDVGFKAFRLDKSNFSEWNPQTTDLHRSLLGSVEHILPDRNDDDLLFEVILKLGIDLAVEIETKSINNVLVRSIGNGALIACLTDAISTADAEPLALGIVAWLEELGTAGATTAVFRDSAFEDDVAKSNLAAILEQHGIKQVRSL